MAEDYLNLLFPEKERLSKAEVIKTFSRLQLTSNSTLLELHKLRLNALDLLNASRSPSDPTIGEILKSLQWLSDLSSKLAVDIGNLPVTKGRAPWNGPVEVAKLAARHFRFFTGEDAGRINQGPAGLRGEFPRFLELVFQALGIKASVDDHAKRAARWWKQDREAEVIAEILSKPPPEKGGMEE